MRKSLLLSAFSLTNEPNPNTKSELCLSGPIAVFESISDGYRLDTRLMI